MKDKQNVEIELDKVAAQLGLPIAFFFNELGDHITSLEKRIKVLEVKMRGRA